MNGVIIVEGCDFSGKSTLIDLLSKRLRAIVIKDNNIPPPSLETAHEWTARINSLSKDRVVICDRSLIISDPIYGSILREGSPLGIPPKLDNLDSEELLGPVLLSCLNDLRAVVWCDPGLDHIQHMDPETQMAGVVGSAAKIHQAYVDARNFYSYLDPYQWKNLHYDFNSQSYEIEGGPERWLLNRLEFLLTQEDSETRRISDFHEKFQVPQPLEVTMLPAEIFKFRLKFLTEELNEFAEAHEKTDPLKMFDALLDLVYVAKGTALMMGISPKLWEYGFNKVNQANMTKVRATREEQSKRGSTLDVIKPPGFIPPERLIAIGMAIQDELNEPEGTNLD